VNKENAMAAMADSKRAAVTLPAPNQIQITRAFDAPRALVFRAWTRPELVARWWAGDRGEVTSIDIDLRPGGSWRYVMTANAGFDVAFHGEYREIVPGERIVYTETFEGAPEATALTTVMFADAGPGTLVTVLVEHRTAADRDMHLDSGMESGLQEAMDKLEEVASSLAG
jgi:uncharacterized protein YndB with AHSA1/START domain